MPKKQPQITPSPPVPLTSPLPKIIIFDLDYTLWPFWVDTHVTPPLKPSAAHTSATDRYSESFAFYTDVPYILSTLPSLGITLCIASRTSAPSQARDLLKMLHLPNGNKAQEAFSGSMEIYPGSKIKHMESIHKKTGIPYEEMLFFDDEQRNIETEKLGVTMKLVRDGVTWDEIEKGVQMWRKRNGRVFK